MAAKRLPVLPIPEETLIASMGNAMIDKGGRLGASSALAEKREEDLSLLAPFGVVAPLRG